MSGTIELYGDPELKRQELDKNTKYLEEIKSQIMALRKEEIDLDMEITKTRAEILPQRTKTENLEYEEKQAQDEYNRFSNNHNQLSEIV